MKKWNFITRALVLLLMGAMLAGCSDKGSESSEEETKKKVEASTDDEASSDEETQSTSDEQNSSVAATIESVPESSSVAEPAGGKEVTGEAEPETEEPKEVEPNGNANPQGNEIEVGDAKQKELIAKYEEYFKNFSMESFMIDMTMNGDMMGQKLTVDVKVGISDGDTYMYIAIPSTKNSMELYFLKDSTAYMKLDVQGEAPAYYVTKDLDQETADEMNFAGGFVGATTGEGVELQYVRSEEINGIIYDVIKPMGNDVEQDMLIYMNRETCTWEKAYVEEDEVEMIADVASLNDPITVPSDFDTAMELDGQSFSYALIFGMAGLTGANSFDLD